MADQTVNLDFKITADDTAEPDIASLNARLDDLTKQLAQQQQQVPASAKDWADYAEQVGRIAEEVAAAGVSFAAMRLTMLQTDVAAAVLSKWTDLVQGVRAAYTGLNTTLLNVADYSLAAVEAGQQAATATLASAQVEAAKYEARITGLAAQFLNLSKVVSVLDFAAVALTIANVGIQAAETNEQTRLLTEQIGGLSRPLQQLDPDSLSVLVAKERFEALQQASIALQQPIETLLPLYKAFFDQTVAESISIKDTGVALTDFLNIQKSLNATAQETATAQSQVTSAFDAGVTSTTQLGYIFGAALLPAMDRVAVEMGITRNQLKELINTGQVGTASVFPALAAAARGSTSALHGAGDAAEYSKQQFKDMGMTFWNLTSSILPGADNALRHTALQIAETADAGVDPIGAAVERIINWGTELADWSKRTEQSIAEVFTGDAVEKAINTGFKEAIGAANLILNDAAHMINATGQSLGVLAGAATTATNPMQALNEVWKTAADRVVAGRDNLQKYIDALEGLDKSTERTTEQSKALADALKTIPVIPFKEELDKVVKSLNATESASSQVEQVWKAMGSLDFTGKSIASLLTLRQAIDAVADKTGNASAAQAAFSKTLEALPTSQLDALIAKVINLQPRLKEAGDEGNLLGAVMAAAFQKTAEAMRLAGENAAKYAQTVQATVDVANKHAETSEKVARALGNEAAATQAVADKAAVNVQSAQAQRVAKQFLVDVSTAYYAKLQQETAGLQVLTDTEMKELAAAKEDAAAKAAAVQQSQEVVQQLQLEAAQLQGVADAHRILTPAVLAGSNAESVLAQQYQATKSSLADVTRLNQDGAATQAQLNTATMAAVQAQTAYKTGLDMVYQAETNRLAAVERAIQKEQARKQLTIDQQNALAAESRALGDSQRATMAASNAIQAQADKERALAAAMQSEIAVLQNLLRLKQAEAAMAADPTAANAEAGKLQDEIALKQTAAQSTQIHAKALQAEADQAQNASSQTDELTASMQSAAPAVEQVTTNVYDAGAGMDGFAKQINQVINAVYSLSKAAGDTFLGIRKPISDVSAAMQELIDKDNQLQATMHENMRIIGSDANWDAWINKANNISQAYYDQALQVQRYTDDLDKMLRTGKVDTEEMLQVQSQLQNGFNMLDKTQLTGLESALDAVKMKITDTNKTLLNLIADSQAGLGNTAAQLQLQHEQRLQQIVDAAQAAGADQRLVEQALKSEDAYFKKLMQDANVAAGALDPATQSITRMTGALNQTLESLGAINTHMQNINQSALLVGNSLAGWGAR